VWSIFVVEQLTETMPEDVREAFADTVRLFNHWRAEPDDMPAPTIGFRSLKVSLSGICDLIASYKNEPLPMGIHDELWRLLEDIKLKAELAMDPSYATGARCLDALIQGRRAAANASTVTLAPSEGPS